MTEKSTHGQCFEVERIGNRVVMTMHLSDDYNAIGFYDTVTMALREDGSVTLDMPVGD